MTDLMELASRVEAGIASRELEMRIKAAVYGGVALQSPFNGEWCIYRAGTTDARTGKIMERPRLIAHADWLRDSYMTSADAAMQLPPGDECWRVGHDADDPSWFMAQCSYTPEPGKMGFIVGRGDTAAAALTAAALRARAHQGTAHVEQ